VPNTEAASAKKPNVAARKREELREKFWPGSGERIWKRRLNDGFTTIPRVLPLVMHLIRHLTPRGDPSRVYWDLWARAWDEGILTVTDEDTWAYSAGYTGTRALRTWREHMLTLQEIGFIEIKPQGNRQIGHILILNPLAVCARLHRDRRRDVPEEWWTAFVHRANEIKAVIPDVSQEDTQGPAAVP